MYEYVYLMFTNLFLEQQQSSDAECPTQTNKQIYLCNRVYRKQIFVLLWISLVINIRDTILTKSM